MCITKETVEECVNWCFLFQLLVINRVALKHFTGHVGVAEAVWKMTCNVSNVSQLVILQVISSVTHVLFAKKVVSFVEGCLILGSMLSLCWLWFLQGNRAWVVEPEDTLTCHRDPTRHEGFLSCLYIYFNGVWHSTIMLLPYLHPSGLIDLV